MSHRPQSKLNSRKAYLQIALNNTLEEAFLIISQLPKSDRILLEVGTPLIKRYGEHGIRQIFQRYKHHLLGKEYLNWFQEVQEPENPDMERMKEFMAQMFQKISPEHQEDQIQSVPSEKEQFFPYVVADLKTMDRGQTEVEIAFRGGASAAIALGSAPIETLNAFIASCESRGLDAMIDMMNVEYPLAVLRKLKKIPPVVILHRGVDEENFNREKQIPLHEIRRIKGSYDIMISIAGGDTVKEVQSAIFNDADIVVIWKSVFTNTKQTVELVNEFLKEVK